MAPSRCSQVRRTFADRSARDTCRVRSSATSVVTSLKPTIQEPGRWQLQSGRACVAGLAILCSLLLGCSGNNGWQPPTVVVDTPTGVTPIYSPAPVMPGGIAGPPPGLENSALPQPTQPTRPVSRDGSYVGTAEPLRNGRRLVHRDPAGIRLPRSRKFRPVRQVPWQHRRQQRPADGLWPGLGHWSVRRRDIPRPVRYQRQLRCT